ncbi:phospholipase D-like domain-containing protein [Aquabacterium sp.]|uniref:phospholipase D-like domain-containing protein n=1 Tax=Aquabacterium sp. TaxID=1872578 RepID=UPI002CB54AC6|nr:phospholipase D family protein [Aquabacterium sp.]HSW07471.1 phospholipase D family protein [Aquabacterium sp.]
MHTPHPRSRSRLPALAVIVLLWLVTALGGCASLPAGAHRPLSQAIEAGDSTLARIARHNTAPRPDPTGQPALSGFRLLPNGDHALDARLALVQRAERSLDAQYYLISADDSGLQFLRALRDAAARGVRVRLLVDDLYTAGEQALLAGLAAHPNVELRLYNPLPVRGGGFATRLLLSLHEFERINQRMHNKLLIADGAFALAGGRNIGDEYFMRGASANFIDLDVLASGPVVAELAAVFDRYWNHPRAWPVQALADGPQDPDALREAFERQVDTAAAGIHVSPRDVLGRSSVSTQLAAGQLDQHFAAVRVVADAPDKAAQAPALPPAPVTPEARPGAGAMDSLLSLMRSARSEVVITSPYFVPGARGIALLQQAADHGIQVRLVTNSIAATDEPLVHWGYARYRPAMLKLGVDIHELSPQLAARSNSLGPFGSSAARLHAKVAVVDRRFVAIGSVNMDGRSARLNTEMGLVIDSPALAADIARLMHPGTAAGSYQLRLVDGGERIEWLASEGGRQQVLAQEPGSGWVTRLKLSLLSLLIAEEML